MEFRLVEGKENWGNEYKLSNTRELEDRERYINREREGTRKEDFENLRGIMGEKLRETMMRFCDTQTIVKLPVVYRGHIKIKIKIIIDFALST